MTEYTQNEDAWFAYQLDLPDQGEGIVVVVKRPLSNFTRAAFPLQALFAEGAYEVTNLDTGEIRNFSGRELGGQGLEMDIPNNPGDACFIYHRKT